MNMTRKFLLDRAAAVVAQIQDKGEAPDVNHRIALRLEYRDLRCALTRIHRSEAPVADNVRVPIADSLWADHCAAHGLSPAHDAFHI